MMLNGITATIKKLKRMKKTLFCLVLVTLIWTDNSTVEEGFGIEWGQGPTPSAWTLIAGTAANVTTYADAGAVPGISNCYRVYAYNIAGRSGPSNMACIDVPIGTVSRAPLTTSPAGTPTGVGAK